LNGSKKKNKNNKSNHYSISEPSLDDYLLLYLPPTFFIQLAKYRKNQKLVHSLLFLFSDYPEGDYVPYESPSITNYSSYYKIDEDSSTSIIQPLSVHITSSSSDLESLTCRHVLFTSSSYFNQLRNQQLPGKKIENDKHTIVRSISFWNYLDEEWKSRRKLEWIRKSLMILIKNGDLINELKSFTVSTRSTSPFKTSHIKVPYAYEEGNASMYGMNGTSQNIFSSNEDGMGQELVYPEIVEITHPLQITKTSPLLTYTPELSELVKGLTELFSLPPPLETILSRNKSPLLSHSSSYIPSHSPEVLDSRLFKQKQFKSVNNVGMVNLMIDLSDNLETNINTLISNFNDYLYGLKNSNITYDSLLLVLQHHLILLKHHSCVKKEKEIKEKLILLNNMYCNRNNWMMIFSYFSEFS
jgi:hypothetical protein